MSSGIVVVCGPIMTIRSSKKSSSNSASFFGTCVDVRYFLYPSVSLLESLTTMSVTCLSFGCFQPVLCVGV